MKIGLDNFQKRYAQAAGLLYIIIIVCGMSSGIFVRSALITPDDANATAQNIINSLALFRLGFVADLIMVMSDVAVAIVFYLLFREVNNGFALLATVFRLVQATIIGISLLHYSTPLLLFAKENYLSVLGAEQFNTQILLSLDAYNYGYLISGAFFGVNCLLMGYLINTSGMFPKYLGAMLFFASFGYLLNSFINFLAPQYGEIGEGILILTALTSELAFCYWLLVKGFISKVSIAATS